MEGAGGYSKRSTSPLDILRAAMALRCRVRIPASVPASCMTHLIYMTAWIPFYQAGKS